MTRLFTLVLVLTTLGINAQNHTCQHFKSKLNGPSNFEKMDASRSDSIDVLNYYLQLDLTDPTGEYLIGNAQIEAVSKVNGVDRVLFDLLLLQVDSVWVDSAMVNYNYNDSLLTINLDNTANTSDTMLINVFYQGAPHKDPSGWGGWYASANYTYNLGVGFQDVSHSYGRIWYPCFDNFVERATYQFDILSSNGKKAYCSGDLNEFTELGGDTILSSWTLDQPIPSYLTSVALSDYTHVEMEYVGINGDTVPMWIACLSDDSASVVNAFQNLDNAMSYFEEAYGLYRWDRVGYAVVPFNGGAMEHATNIAFPRSSSLSLNIANQRLMAHELAHHWWGNLVTCQDPKEMWINEGWASFSEFIFVEGLNGEQAYREAVKDNHTTVVSSAHVSDGGFLTINEVPSDVTYGDHSYKKGADLAHTLRGYLGDSLFFESITNALQSHPFDDMSSEELRDYLNETPGVDATDYFEDWIFNPGFPHFSVDSFQVAPLGNDYEVTAYVSQKLFAAPHLYNNVPIDISVMDENREWFHQPVVMSGQSDSFTFTSPILPQMATMDYYNKISHAVTYDSLTIDEAANYTLSASKLYLMVDEVADDSYLRILHNWVAPANEVDEDYVINKNRYWRLEGDIEPGTVFSARFNFDGRPVGAHLDDSLYQYMGNGIDENHLKLLYRSGPGEKWRAWEYQDMNPMGNATNFAGFFTADSLALGEYTFGFALADVGLNEIEPVAMSLYPNPTNETLYIQGDFGEGVKLKIYNELGQLVDEHSNYSGASVDVSKFHDGLYIIQVKGDKGIQSLKFIKQ